MLPDWVSNPGPLTYESGALQIALHGPTKMTNVSNQSIAVEESTSVQRVRCTGTVDCPHLNSDDTVIEG